MKNVCMKKIFLLNKNIHIVATDDQIQNVFLKTNN